MFAHRAGFGGQAPAGSTAPARVAALAAPARQLLLEMLDEVSRPMTARELEHALRASGRVGEAQLPASLRALGRLAIIMALPAVAGSSTCRGSPLPEVSGRLELASLQLLEEISRPLTVREVEACLRSANIPKSHRAWLAGALKGLAIIAIFPAGTDQGGLTESVNGSRTWASDARDVRTEARDAPTTIGAFGLGR